MKRPLIAVILISFFSCMILAQRMPENIVKVGVIRKASSFNLSSQGDYRLFEVSSGNKGTIEPLNDYLVKAVGDEIHFGGDSYSSPIRIMPGATEDRVKINGHRYRDSLLVYAKNGTLSVVNELGIEDYIYGILPREASPSWPLESLKAQAVVSRTYALRNLKRHQADGYDLCNTVHCQVYGGVESEDPRSNKAVDETRSEVLVFEEKLATTVFHACCGGHTERPTDVWAWDQTYPEYLKGVYCKFCKESPHMNWKKEVSAEALKNAFIKGGYPVGTIKDISRHQKTSSGRIRALKIKHSNGTTIIPSGKARLMVGPELIRSTYIDSITKSGNKYIIKGRGWGHGVGMCQWGAKVMSEKGYDYEDILKTYYPGTEIETWEE